MNIYNLVSFLGVFVFIALLIVLSRAKKRIKAKVLAWGVALQAGLALFIFVLPVGKKVFNLVNHWALALIQSSQEGVRFLFGRLAIPPGGHESLGFILAFQALPTIIFFAGLMGLLYHFGIMERLIGIFAKVFLRIMGLSGAESFCASAQIFLGIESNLTIMPYLKVMTRSELMVVLTTGMATIASSVLGLYVIILKDQLPNVAGHLVAASVLLAPSALIASKVLIPETEIPLTMGKVVRVEYERAGNAIEAVINGAMSGVKMVVSIGALLIAFIGLIHLLDTIVYHGVKVMGGFVGLGLEITISRLLSFIFYPFTLAMGVPLEDAMAVAGILAERILATEVKSYQELARLIKEGGLVHERSAVIATYALCGFAHVPSLAIFVGGTASLAPERTKEISTLGLWALLAANISCFITGALVGVFYVGGRLQTF